MLYMDDILHMDLLSIKKEYFNSLPRIDQVRILKVLDNTISNQTGKTTVEADKKRIPFINKYKELKGESCTLNT